MSATAPGDPLDSLTSYVDGGDLGWTLAPPATRQTARYGIRRPRRNSYAEIIYSQAPVLPTNPTRVTPRKNCRRGTCSSCFQANAVLESKELLCGDCLQSVRGPGQPAWVDAYATRDEMTKLLIDSDARDALIRKAYEDAANQSSQTASKPVLCKALARLYQHGSDRPMRANPHWTEQDWKVARWYCNNCYPYVSPAGSVMWSERPLVPKSWIDNVVRTLGPIYNYQNANCACIGAGGCGVRGCPCPPESRARGVYPRAPVNDADANGTQQQQQQQQQQCNQSCARLPTQNQQARAQRTAAADFYQSQQACNQAATLQHYTGNYGVPLSHNNRFNCAPQPSDAARSEFYSLLAENAAGRATRERMARAIAEQRERLNAANTDYGERVYQAQVADHRAQSGANQVRMSRFLDPTVPGNTPTSSF